MSEAVEILIAADDQASVKLAQAAENVAKAEKKVDNVVKSLKSPLEKYEAQLKELEQLHEQGVISTEKYATAQAALQDKIEDSSNAYKEVGGKAKSAAEFVGTLANIAGGGELAGYASQLAEVTDRVGNFSESTKGSKASALAFKGGLVALVGTIGLKLGTALGHAIFQTEKFNRAMENTKTTAADLNSAVASSLQNIYTSRREDIELIRDPEQKKAAYAELLEGLNRDVSAVSAQVRKGERVVEEWAAAWQITGERKASAAMAEEELTNDRERLKAIKAQRDELIRVTSVRAAENAEIAKKNELAASSEDYLQGLREEVELLKATKAQQIQINAARNTTTADRGAAEQLLRERDALEAKKEAEQEAARVKQAAIEEQKNQTQQSAEYVKALRDEITYLQATKAQQIALDAAKNTNNAKDQSEAERLIRERDLQREKIKAVEDLAKAKAKAAQEAQREAERAKQQAADEIQKVADLIAAEERRLNVRNIALTQGKEAAKAQALMDQGIDKETAQRLAAKEAAISALEKQKGKEGTGDKSTGTLKAAESRLATRGSGEQRQEQMLRVSEASQKLLAKIAAGIDSSNDKLSTKQKTDLSIQVVTP